MSTIVTQSPPAIHVATAVCFHCGLPVPRGIDLTVDIEGAARPMCCHGCEAVTQAIVNGGLSDYYKYRTAEAPTAREIMPEFLRQTTLYDHPEIQKSFVRADGEHVREAALILEGITCPACVWLNERHLAHVPGVLSAHINYATHRARVRWDERHIHLSDILQAVSRIGYLAHPFDPGRYQQQLENDRRQLLRRVGVAGVFGMQVMTLSVALYVGDWSGVEIEYRRFFYWVSLLLTLPVLLYSAQPFFRSAWRDLKHFRTGMDVPVSLGIGAAFLASLWTTVTGEGTVYYDSVCMFAFFLLTARYFELAAHKRASEASETLVRATPAMATRITEVANPSPSSLLPEGEGGEPRESIYMAETVAVAELQTGDRVRIRPGESIPADSVVLEGRSTVDESLLTGENLPVTKGPGQPLIGGTLNIESPLTARVEKTGPDTILSSILRLLDRASSEKPRLAQLADRIAAGFVAAVLLLAAFVAFYWWTHDAALWLPATIAVLVVTCPCALSLATPAAITAATGQLTRLGLLVTRGHALETLAHATHFIFDKTGTLTRGRLHLLETRTISSLTANQSLGIASALERHSEHPIARALIEACQQSAPTASEVINTPGAGLCGLVNNQKYFLGTPSYIEEQTKHIVETGMLGQLRSAGDTVVLLAGTDKLHAAFVLSDEVRPGARELIDELHRQGKSTMLLTGDHEMAARRVAGALGINELAWDLKPADKLECIKTLQQQGAVAAMIGDGVNDAPVLAAAQVSIAMGGGTAVAAASADMILLSQKLSHLADGLAVSRRTLGIIRQNLVWAVAYNLIALPVAAAGYLSPWMAALGMSASSLLVVANALRLTRPRASKLASTTVMAAG
ncbi:MAG: heavy metal translocating P-type ATPase [Sulfuricaulis sp.]|uniref:heavy metal translocating P-type ATPase n=1 Tax=Sulfuricaulis sp. TaxID=2003553 RepID=UPI0025FCA759|nr:heavy metal translocating P-type ATPase [Sulfuricaulis sp.]MCR4346094.1 heavy metal translocating P-type ATPase [Sulfuricaulis sp.]